MRKLLRSLAPSLPCCVVLIAVTGTALAQEQVGHPETVPGRDPLASSMVEVSVRQLRIAFPIDTTGEWGWPQGERMGRRYEWATLVDGMDGPTRISLAVYPQDSTDRGYSSLPELVAAGQAKLCIVRSMISPCNETPLVRSTAEGHRVVLTLSDSILIRELFGTRPDSVRVIRQSAGPETHESQWVPVRYVAPYVPVPDSALLAEAQRRRRRYEASITTITRTIRGGEDRWDVEDIWVAVGDSIRLDVRETHCKYDRCWSLGWPAGDSGWTVKNSRIVSLHRTCGPVCVMAHGRRIGRTVVSVRGLHGRSDAIPSRSPPPRTVERRIRVGRPVRQIRILPRPDTVRLGRPETFSARALDRAGRVVPEVPIEIVVETDSVYKQGMLATRPRPIVFEQPGRRAVIATFRGLADTLIVTVIAATE